MKSTPTVPSTAPAAEWVAVGKLTPWANNPRKNDPAVPGVMASIKRFGFGAPLLARRETGEIIAGHTRLKAASKLGMVEVPVRYLDLSAEEAHALALADNKLGEKAEWDEELLQGVLQELDAKNVEVDDLGFADNDLKRMLAEAEDGGLDDSIDREFNYQVLIECENEDDQAEALKKIEELGLKCRPLIL